MRRREFITLAGGAAAWSMAARAQQASMPVVGFLGGENPELYADRLRAFQQGLGEIGYIDGQNVAIDYYWAEGNYDRLPAIARNMVESGVRVIVTAGGSRPALAAKELTSTIPIVFEGGFDPVGLGLVAKLNRPGRNVTGVATLNAELASKLLEMIHDLEPTATNVAFVMDPNNPVNSKFVVDPLQSAANILGFQLQLLYASTESELISLFSNFAHARPDALVFSNDTFLMARSKLLAILTQEHGIVAISPDREFAVAGGLMSYGSDLKDAYHLEGIFTGRILKGESPAEMPVQQSTKVQLVINMKAAKNLGITFPTILLGRADEVVE